MGCGKISSVRSTDESPKGTFVMPTIKKCLRALWADESGVSAVEYVLLLALIGGTLIVGASEMGFVVEDKLTTTAVCIQTNGGTC